MSNGHGKTPEDFKKQMEDNMRAKENENSHVKKVIGIVSGKGGVGKSLITGLAASCMNKKGYKTAIMDADITGPSIPKMFGIGKLNFADENGNMLPADTAGGMKIMSLNMLMENETDPVIWRGPVIAGIVKQFWSDVNWGDIDFMFVDMPPGTGDVPLTVFQSLPVDGIIVVATPQELVGMIVEKAINMAKLMNIPVLGIVENMSYMTCPHCNEPIYIFGESKIDSYAASLGLNVLGKIPVNPDYASKCDAGKAEEIEVEGLDSLVYVLDEMIKE
ncbi:MAG: Mrp/NBP35 family ATP-binding protein [Butyrivibrio sp.]|nr:Mrp/NBP35 family ATP-binding protein [Butyrivibrio sp.]